MCELANLLEKKVEGELLQSSKYIVSQVVSQEQNSEEEEISQEKKVALDEISQEEFNAKTHQDLRKQYRQRIKQIKDEVEMIKTEIRNLSLELHRSAISGNLNTAKALIRNGANLNHIEFDKYYAVSEFIDIAMLLNRSPMMSAASHGQLYMIELFANHDATCIHTQDKALFTPIFYALANNRIDAAKLLFSRFQAKVDIFMFIKRKSDSSNWYPSLLSYFCRENPNPEFIQIILTFLSEKGNQGKIDKYHLEYHDGENTALGHILSKDNKMENRRLIAEMLFDYGARIFTINGSQTQGTLDKMSKNYTTILDRIWLEAESEYFFKNPNHTSLSMGTFRTILYQVSGSFFNFFKPRLAKLWEFQEINKRQENGFGSVLVDQELMGFDIKPYQKLQEALPAEFVSGSANAIGIILGYLYAGAGSKMCRFQSEDNSEKVANLHFKRFNHVIWTFDKIKSANSIEMDKENKKDSKIKETTNNDGKLSSIINNEKTSKSCQIL